MKRIATILVSGFVLTTLLGAAVSSAAMIYFDDFADMEGSLDERTPPVTTDNASWDSYGYLSDAGDDFLRVNSQPRSAFLPFSPTSGFLYTYSVQLGHTGGTGTSWAAMGFNLNDSGGTTQQFNDNNGLGVVALRQSGNFQWWAGPELAGTNVTGSVSDYAAGQFYDFMLQLDTRGSDWTLNLYVDGNQIDISGGSPGMSHVYATPPNIQRIQLSNSATTAIFDNVELTVVPEPTTLVLLGLAGLLLIRRRPV